MGVVKVGGQQMSYRPYPVTDRLFWTDFEEISRVLNIYSNINTTGRRSADGVVVVVKLETDENMVTYLRIKSLESERKLGGKGLHT
jgi:hypothetical protein